MDETAKPEVAHDRPAKFDDLLFRVVLQQLVKQFLVDIVVVDEKALRMVQGRLVRVAEVRLAPRGWSSHCR
jgi:hypothetical protein